MIASEGAAALPDEGIEQATTASDFFDKLVDLFYKIATAIVNAIVAPFEAFANIWGNWSDQLGEWYAPLLLIIVIVGALLIWRGYVMFDKILDSMN